jgi:hypothetical protein
MLSGPIAIFENNLITMITTIEDSELDTELQELYLTGKQWLAELEFLSAELIFLGKFSQKIYAQVKKTTFPQELLELKQECQELKDEVRKLNLIIGEVVVASEKKIGLCVLENHIELKSRIQVLTRSIRNERKSLLAMLS